LTTLIQRSPTHALRRKPSSLRPTLLLTSPHDWPILVTIALLRLTLWPKSSSFTARKPRPSWRYKIVFALPDLKRIPGPASLAQRCHLPFNQIVKDQLAQPAMRKSEDSRPQVKQATFSRRERTSLG
jgi:hypothetical protein